MSSGFLALSAREQYLVHLEKKPKESNRLSRACPVSLRRGAMQLLLALAALLPGLRADAVDDFLRSLRVRRQVSPLSPPPFRPAQRGARACSRSGAWAWTTSRCWAAAAAPTSAATSPAASSMPRWAATGPRPISAATRTPAAPSRPCKHCSLPCPSLLAVMLMSKLPGVSCDEKKVWCQWEEGWRRRARG